MAANAMTYADYLAFERASETKHEYVNGLVYAMAPPTAPWSRLAVCGRLLAPGQVATVDLVVATAS